MKKTNLKNNPSKPLFNPETGKLTVSLFSLVKEMGVPIEVAINMSSQSICPLCGDTAAPAATGKVSLCEKDFVIFYTLTKGEEAARLGSRINKMDPRDWGRLERDEISLLPPKEMVTTITGKTAEQAGMESLHGHCPICEKPHKKGYLKIRVGDDGLCRKIVFCSDCMDLYVRRNKIAKSIALLARGGR